MTLLKVSFMSSQHFMVKQWIEMFENNLYCKAAPYSIMTLFLKTQQYLGPGHINQLAVAWIPRDSVAV